MRGLNRNTDVFIKIYRSFLRDGGELQINQIINPYLHMNGALHPLASAPDIDFPAFMYAFLRLPESTRAMKRVILSQTEDIFMREGYDTTGWQIVTSPARRRKMMYDGQDTGGVFINSVTDVDDIVCLLAAFQIEWNKMHERMRVYNKHTMQNDPDMLRKIGMSQEIESKLRILWRTEFTSWIGDIYDRPLDIRVRLLRGSYVDYQKAAQRWFEYIVDTGKYKDIQEKPVYFVSSNTHSLVNNITGYVNTCEDELISYLESRALDEYLRYWEQIKKGTLPGSKENFLWYVMKKYERDNPEARLKRIAFEQKLGIDYIEARHYLDINAQIIHVRELAHKKDLADKLNLNLKKLRTSDAYIFNIDYPLGFGAYMVLSTVLRNIQRPKGVYIMGKASFLHGNLGDIGLSSVVYDAHSRNTFIFKNAFDAGYFTDFKSGNLLTAQKAIATKGTLLHSDEEIKDFFTDGYSIVEMENGPYLNALYELSNYSRYPEGEIIDLTQTPVDLGLIHYASDTPFTKAVTLATRNLGYEGMDATYSSSLAILKRIVEMETR